MAAARGEGLTDQQRRAIAARGVSVALSAGAGCGKTFVLTRRFLHELDPDGSRAQPSGLGELVAITFTERAAREMRDRIRAACRERLLEAPQERVGYWLGLFRELDSARISTIHSFCGALLRSHAVEAGLDPHFRVLEQAEADTLLNELVDDELRDRLVAKDEAVIELVVEFGLESLRQMVATFLGRRQEIDWAAWEQTTPSELVARWEKFARETLLPRRLRTLVESPAARALLEIIRQHSLTNPTMRARCQALEELLVRLPESADPASDLQAIVEHARVQGGGNRKTWPSDEVYERFRDAADGLRTAAKGAMEEAGFDAAAALPAAQSALRVLAVSRAVAAAYEARKKELAALDFNDLLIYAKRLLTAPESEPLRKQLSAQIGLLLVDEFQDTDPLQVELVKALCGPLLRKGKLFFVGDFKQSIYRFRGARPDVFRDLRNDIPAEGRLPLTLNFRSQPAVLDFVNALFCEELRPEYEPLRAHRPQVSPEPAIELMWVPDPLPEQRSGKAERMRRLEAEWIARRLRAMFDRGEKLVCDKAGAGQGLAATRAVRPGDVALLFRALSDVQFYEEALQRYEVPYYLVGGHAFYAQQEIFDLLNLLRSLASRSDEVSLAGVLRSPMFALEDETLYWLAQHPGGLAAGLMDQPPPAELSVCSGSSPLSFDGRGVGGEGVGDLRMIERPLTPSPSPASGRGELLEQTLSDDQRRRVEFARATLSRLRAIKDRVPIAELIEEALSRTGYDAVLVAEFLGERKLANLRKLVDQARSFDRSGVLTLSDFITQLAEFVVRQPDEPLAATQPETSDVVRLMTIHQAKGLEFPVVVVPDADRPIRSSSARAAFTSELGPMVRTLGPGGMGLHLALEGEEDRAELIRLFYVATTRAADHLIISGGGDEFGSARRPWTELLNRRFDPATGELRVRLPAGYRRPNVAVITTEPAPVKPASRSSRPRLDKLADRAIQLADEGSGRVPPLLGPLAADRTARRAYSFSRLSGQLHAEQEAAAAIDLEGDGPGVAEPGRPVLLDPLGLGTLVHDVLADVDFARPDDAEALVRRFAPRHLPEVEDHGNGQPPASSLDGLDEPIDLVRRFLASPRAAEIAASARVYRELEFLLAWPPDTQEPQPRYLQGFIDCLYQDAAGRWVVVDYKTNQVTAATVVSVAAGYEMQMLVYALAVERILGSPPSDLVLCFLRPGLEHHFAWDDAARKRVVELVNRGLAACVEG